MSTFMPKTPEDTELVDPLNYRILVGSLHYLTLTRPDIVHVVNKVYQYLQQLQHQHLQGEMRIFRYLKRTPPHSISFHRNNPTITRTRLKTCYPTHDVTRAALMPQVEIS